MHEVVVLSFFFTTRDIRHLWELLLCRHSRTIDDDKCFDIKKTQEHNQNGYHEQQWKFYSNHETIWKAKIESSTWIISCVIIVSTSK